MEAVTKWISAVMIVLIIAYLVAPGSNASAVIKSLGNASAQNVRALAGGVPVNPSTQNPTYANY